MLKTVMGMMLPLKKNPIADKENDFAGKSRFVAC